MIEEQTTFKITLSQDFYTPDDILVTTKGGTVHITGDFETKNNKWYHKLINLITFKKYCNKYYVYDCEIRRK